MAQKVNPKWVAIVKDLRAAAKEVKDAQAAHAEAVENAKRALDAAEAKLSKAIKRATTVIDDLADTPPGTFPAVTS